MARTREGETHGVRAMMCCGASSVVRADGPVLLGVATTARPEKGAKACDALKPGDIDVELASGCVEEAPPERAPRQSARESARGSMLSASSKLQEHVAVAAGGARKRYSVQPSSVTKLYDLYYTGKSGSHVRLRWNLLWAMFALLGVYPFFAALPSACSAIYSTTLTLAAVQALLLSVGAISCWVYMGKMWWATKVSWDLLAAEKFGEEEVERVRHIFVLPAYKEPLELLENTVATVAEQTIAKKIVMVVTLEESSPTLTIAKETLPKRFSDSFAKVIVTMHPKGLPDEIPGACSNRNWGVRRAVQIMDDELEPDDDSTLVTVCDSDTVFHSRYAECLTHKFLATKNRVDKCYQSPLFYNISLDQRYFFTRVTAVIRAFLMVGFLIPMSINTMSIYSIPLTLLKKAKFFHPGYQMDDIIFTLSAMQAIGKRVFIQQIEVPTLSGPTSGESFTEELLEWYVQAKRWTIGAGEVFHYFFIKMLKQKFTFMSGMSYGLWLTVYYAFFLCAAGIVTLSHTVVRVLFGIVDPQRGMESCLEGTYLDFGVPVQWLDLSITVYTYFIFFGTAFVMDRRLVSVLGLSEKVGCLRTLMHFLLSQLVLWAYCVVECFSIAVLAVYGKKVCGHKPSNKESLVAKK